MKKSNLITTMSIIAASLLYSCTSELETESQLTNENPSKLASKESPCRLFEFAAESTIIPGVKAINLDNGISTACKNNVLIFPTLDDYERTIDLLDQKIDNFNDSFDQQTIGMTDIEADDYAESIAFDEDQPLTDFEKELDFCSLRSFLIPLGEDWLNHQGDGAWNLNTDPDSYYIEDDTERSLLSIGSEFIVGNCKNGYTLYKKYDWGYVTFPITDTGTASVVLKTLNNITNPTQQPINVDGATQIQVTKFLAPHEPIKYTITTTIPPVPPSGSGGCKEYAKDKSEHLFSPERKIIWKHKYDKVKSFPSNTIGIKAKSLTRSYRKKKGKWKTYRATIAAGFFGDTYKYCSRSISMNEEKQRRRKRLKLIKRLPESSGITQDHKIKPGKLFSVHRQEGNYFQKDL